MRVTLALLAVASALLVAPATSAPKRCPRLMVPASKGVCIDQFEWPNKPGRKPKLGISGIVEEADHGGKAVWDAESLCASVGKRVCTAEEWIAACEGQGGSKFPFGEKIPKYTPGDGTGLCNYDKVFRTPDEYLVFKRDAKEMEYLDQSEPAGHRTTCRSWSGAYDMMGNAEEWVRCNHGTDGWCLASRFWAEPRNCRALVRSHSPRWHYYDTSTRCCLDVKEAE